jgi:MFS family permease
VARHAVNHAAVAPWYRALDRKQWYTLGAANLGWVFDGYETYALILTVAAVFRQLLSGDQLTAIPFYAGLTIAVTLLGWGIGGIVGGILSDYIGRKRMLIYAILAYSLTTGLTAIRSASTPVMVSACSSRAVASSRRRHSSRCSATASASFRVMKRRRRPRSGRAVSPSSAASPSDTASRNRAFIRANHDEVSPSPSVTGTDEPSQ